MTFGEGLYRETIADSKEWEASPKAGFKEMAYYMAGLSYSRLQMRDSADYYLRLAVDSSLAKDINGMPIILPAITRISCMTLIPRLLSAICVC